jgi:hypothetical protein
VEKYDYNGIYVAISIRACTHDVSAAIQRKNIHEWLLPPDHISVQDYVSARLEPGTGTWFLNGSMFIKWKNQKRSRLWLQGGRRLNFLIFAQSLRTGLLLRRYPISRDWEDLSLVGIITVRRNELTYHAVRQLSTL